MDREAFITLKHGPEFRRCLDELDVIGIMKLWRHVSPHLPQPSSGAEALMMLHYARTGSRSIRLTKRAYSHRWLLDHGFPSDLPDDLKPKAERMYPTTVEGVGVAIKASSDFTRPLVPILQGAMNDAILECYADRRTDPEHVKKRMLEAKKITIQKLLGSTTIIGGK